ncbi:lipase family protein [Ralstonia pseudosolanacearum]|uniref:lipase family protein n=1 Tax=Ralstonia pseudosolanacearum TaxID=1310165 RepID=UPI003EDEBCB3
MTPRDYAQLAQRAYMVQPQVGAESSAARAIIEGDAVAFPGTNNVACWLANLDAEIVQVEGLGGLHHGFWGALGEIKSQLLALPAPAIAVGHSEGAALAILFAAVLCLAGQPPRAVYGFEPPRVSVDGTLASLLVTHGVQVNLYRNGADVVPLVPSLLHAWQHPAQLIEIGRPSLPIPNVRDHALERVIQALS